MARPSRFPQASHLRGFTLLEILLVLVVMGLAATAVTFTMGSDPRVKVLEEAGTEFRLVMTMVLEESMLSGEQFGVVMEDDHYYFTRWNIEDDKWEEMSGDPLYRERKLPENVVTDLEVEGLPLVQDDEDEESEFGLDKSLFEPSDEEKRKNPEPQLLILPSGEMTGFSLWFVAEEPGMDELEWEMVGDPLGRIAWARELEQEEEDDEWR